MTNAAHLETETSTAGGEGMNWSSFFAGIGACVVCGSIVLAIILVVAFAF